MKALSFLIMVLSFFIVFTQVQPVMAQEKKGKLGDFEDAAKGKKNKDKDDDDDNDDGGWLGFFVNIVLNSDDDNDDSNNNDFDGLNEREISYGAFPYDHNGMIHISYDSLSGKSFLGRISGGYQSAGSNISGLRLEGQLQFSSRHGLHFDFVSYSEDLKTRTDNTQVINAEYRNLLLANNQLLVGGNIGLIVINPDKFENAIWGLNFAADAQWFVVNPISLNAKVGFAPIIEYLFQKEPPAIWNLEIGAGLHFNNIELYGTYKTLIPTINTDASIYGPEFGIRFWF